MCFYNIDALNFQLHCVDFDLMSKVEIHEYFTYFCRKSEYFEIVPGILIKISFSSFSILVFISHLNMPFKFQSFVS